MATSSTQVIVGGDRPRRAGRSRCACRTTCWRRLAIPLILVGRWRRCCCRSCPASARRSTTPGRGCARAVQLPAVGVPEAGRAAVLRRPARHAAQTEMPNVRPHAVAGRCASPPLGAGAVPAAGRPRLGDRAGAIVLAVAFIGGAPLIPMLASASSAPAAALVFVFSSQRRVQPLHGVPRHHRPPRPPQLPDVPGDDRIANGGLTGSASAPATASGATCRWPTATSSSPSSPRSSASIGVVAVHRRLPAARLLRRAGRARRAATASACCSPAASSAWLVVQAVINVGGVTGMMPVTGLTLPFFSAGGSSLFVSMAAAGLLLNVARHVRDRASTRPPTVRRRHRRRHGRPRAAGAGHRRGARRRRPRAGRRSTTSAPSAASRPRCCRRPVTRTRSSTSSACSAALDRLATWRSCRSSSRADAPARAAAARAASGRGRVASAATPAARPCSPPGWPHPGRRRQLRPPPRAGERADAPGSPRPRAVAFAGLAAAARRASPARRCAGRSSPSTAAATATRPAPRSGCPPTGSWSPSSAARSARRRSTTPSPALRRAATPTDADLAVRHVVGDRFLAGGCRRTRRRDGHPVPAWSATRTHADGSTRRPTCWSAAAARARSPRLAATGHRRRSSCRGRAPPRTTRPTTRAGSATRARRSLARRRPSVGRRLGRRDRRGSRADPTRARRARPPRRARPASVHRSGALVDARRGRGRRSMAPVDRQPVAP